MSGSWELVHVFGEGVDDSAGCHVFQGIKGDSSCYEAGADENPPLMGPSSPMFNGYWAPAV